MDNNELDELKEALRDLDSKTDKIKDRLNAVWIQEHGAFASLIVLILILTKSDMDWTYTLLIALGVGFFFAFYEQHSMNK